MRFLLDTNICIYIIKQTPLSVFKKFKKLELGDIGLSSVTVAELYYGVAKSQHKEKNNLALENFLLPLEIVSFDEQAAVCYGDLRTQLENIGQPIGPLDLMIAAQAKSMGVVLVTNNLKEFNKIAGLKVENWV